MRADTHIMIMRSVCMRKSTVRISTDVREELKKIGRKSDTYDDVIKTLIKHVMNCDRFWENRT